MTMTPGHPLNTATKNTLEGRAGRLWAAILEPVARQLADWSYRRNSRRRLQAMDGHMLNDIGLSREDALTEGLKPFWRA